MTHLTSWGLYPKIESCVEMPIAGSTVSSIIQKSSELTARGNGRSYGDSALGERVISSLAMDHIVELNQANQTIRVRAGMTIDRLLEFLTPRGFFPPVVPGTKYITIGGAVASDIHGKNHHTEGTFTEHVKGLSLITADGEAIHCSKNENPELFRATCGGMGLTGFIHEVEFSIKPIHGTKIHQTSHRAANLTELFELFDLYRDHQYSVAWIDCMSTGKSFGRGVMFAGKHSSDRSTQFTTKQFPIGVPPFNKGILNSNVSRMFNFLYFHRHVKKISEHVSEMDSFFFPLDKIRYWNHLYGSRGFTQYQFVVPKSCGIQGITEVLSKVSAKKNTSFLAVLKLFGPQNENYLSFPMEGYTLSLDFQITDDLFSFLAELNQIVIAHGGRVYLTKDVSLSKNDFVRMYEKQIESFQRVRKKFNAMKFTSLQARRLGL